MSAAEPTRLRKITLAEKLGVSRPTLDKYLAMDGAPAEGEDKKYDVEAVTLHIQKKTTGEGRGFGKQDGTSGTVNGSGEKGKPTLHDLKAEKLSLECQKLRHALEVDRGDYISKKVAADTIIPVMQELGSLMTQTFEMELPSRYIGRDAVDCAKLNAEGNDKIIARFKKGMKKFLV